MLQKKSYTKVAKETNIKKLQARSARQRQARLWELLGSLVARCCYCVKSNHFYLIVKNTTFDGHKYMQKIDPNTHQIREIGRFRICRPADSCHVLFLRPGSEAMRSRCFSPCSISCRISAFIGSFPSHLTPQPAQTIEVFGSAAGKPQAFQPCRKSVKHVALRRLRRGSCEMPCICHILSWDSVFRLGQITHKLSCRIFNAVTVESS